LISAYFVALRCRFGALNSDLRTPMTPSMRAIKAAEDFVSRDEFKKQATR
jgi:hypothetical protein